MKKNYVTYFFEKTGIGLFFFLLSAVAFGAIFFLQKDLIWGFDLKGGSLAQCVFSSQDALKYDLHLLSEQMLLKLNRSGLRQLIKNIYFVDQSICLEATSVSDAKVVVSFLKQELSSGLVKQNGSLCLIRLKNTGQSSLAKIKEKLILLYENRLLSFGLKGVEIIPQNENRFFIKVPQKTDLLFLKQLFIEQGSVDFRLIQGAAETRQELLAPFGGKVPNGSVLLTRHADGTALFDQYYLAAQLPDVLGLHIVSTKVIDRLGQLPAIQILLDEMGADALLQVTAAHKGGRMGLIIDGKVAYDFVIEKELGRQFLIQGSFVLSGLRRLSSLIKNGGIPIPVQFVFQENKVFSRWKIVFQCVFFIVLLTICFFAFLFRVKFLFVLFGLICAAASLLIALVLTKNPLTELLIGFFCMIFPMSFFYLKLIFEPLKLDLSHKISDLRHFMKGFDLFVFLMIGFFSFRFFGDDRCYHPLFFLMIGIVTLLFFTFLGYKVMYGVAVEKSQRMHKR